MTDDQLALVAKALAHPARIRILGLLAEQTECRGHELFSERPLAQSTISEHLRVLKDAGLVTSKPIGTAMLYCLDATVLRKFTDAVAEMAAGAADCAAERKGC